MESSVVYVSGLVLAGFLWAGFRATGLQVRNKGANAGRHGYPFGGARVSGAWSAVLVIGLFWIWLPLMFLPVLTFSQFVMFALAWGYFLIHTYAYSIGFPAICAAIGSAMLHVFSFNPDADSNA